MISANASVRTIQRALLQHGYHQRVAQKVPYLSPHHRRLRLAWARINKPLKIWDFQRKIYSDECYIYLSNRNGWVYITRRADEEYLEECLVPTFKQSSICVMVWGCIMEGMKGPLVVLEYLGGREGGMNSEWYQKQVLEDVLINFYKKMNQEQKSIEFQQDGASYHHSKSTMKWFSEHQIPLVNHLPSLPDLNPIEPIWHDLKTMIRQIQPPPTTLTALKATIFKMWDKIQIETMDKHIGKMGKQVEAVLAANGGHTQF